MARYYHALDSLVAVRDSMDARQVLPRPDAYYFRLTTPGTLYQASVHQFFANVDTTNISEQGKRTRSVNHSLARLYTANPWLVSQTEGQIKEQGLIREDITKETMRADNNLSEKVLEANLGPEMDEIVTVITRRPNFWKFQSNSSINFNQNYSSKNWGNSNVFSGLATFTLNTTYNSQRKLNISNVFNIRLGFQTNKNDKNRTFTPTSNAMDNTTNAGWKFHKWWNYSLQVRMSTQVVPAYAANTDNVTTDVLSPLNVTIAPGLTTSFQWGKKKKFTGNMSMAPLAYNIVYCQRSSLVTRNGIKAGHHSRHSFGPNITVNYNWPVSKNINWSSRVFWYSNLHMTKIEWENNFRFTINKLISASLHLYPRMDDSNPSIKNEHGRYIQFKEDLALGLNYSF